MQEQEEKINVLALILLIILIGINSIAILFIIGVSRVDAATQYRYRNSSNEFSTWENATQDTTYSFTQNTSNNYVVGVQFQDTTKFSGTNKYDYFVSGTYTLSGFTATIYNFNVQTYIYNGTNLTNVSSQCTYNGTQTNVNDGAIVKKTLAFSINCTGLTGANYYPYMTIQIKSNNGANTRSTLYISRFSLIQTSANLDSSSIINNNNNNTQSIINNNNQNTETIVNNQNENTNKQIESQQVCNLNASIVKDNYLINSNGTEETNNNFGISDYIDVKSITITATNDNGYASYCFYKSDKIKINCLTNTNLQIGGLQNIPINAKYVRLSIDKRSNKPQAKICKNGNQAIYDQNNEDNWQQDNPDETGQNSLENSEGLLNNYLANDSDLEQLTIDVNPNDYTTIWEIFNRIITGNTVFYSTFITILTFGIIKTILAR